MSEAPAYGQIRESLYWPGYRFLVLARHATRPAWYVLVLTHEQAVITHSTLVIVDGTKLIGRMA